VKPTLGVANYIISKYDRVTASGEKSFLFVLLSDGRPYFSVSSNGTDDNGVTSTKSVKDGTWSHVVARYDGETLKTFINTVETGTKNYNLGINAGTEDLYIGARRTKDPYFNGTIGEVRIYNRALSSSEIRYLHFSHGEMLRANSVSNYVINGWVVSNNYASLSQLEDVRAYLNGTSATLVDEYGVCRFIFDVPQEVGIYTYEVTVDHMAEKGETYVSIIVDRVVVSEYGASDAWTGQEAIAWFRLKSEFDGQPVESGCVIFTGGRNAAWNPQNSRWEYRESRNNEGNLTLTVESVLWSKYEITSLHPSSKNKAAIIYWQRPPWYYPIVTSANRTTMWLLALPLITWGILGTLVILAVLLKIGILQVKIEKPQEPIEELRKQINSLLQPLAHKNNEYTLLLHFLHLLLEEKPSTEFIEFLRKHLPTIIEHVSKPTEENT